jgi:hypothetical protein
MLKKSNSSNVALLELLDLGRSFLHQLSSHLEPDRKFVNYGISCFVT